MTEQEKQILRQLRRRWPQGKPSKKLLAFAKAAVRKIRHSPKLWCVYGDLLQLQKLYDHVVYGPEEFIGCYLAAIALDPTFVEAYRELGYIYDLMERVEISELCFRKAISLAPNDIENYVGLAQVLSDSGKRKRSIRLLETCPLAETRKIKSLLQSLRSGA